MALAMSAPTSPDTEQQPRLDLVDVSAFSPPGGAAGSEVLVQVFLHRLDTAAIAAERAEAADPDTTIRGAATLASANARGQDVGILLEGPDATVDEPMQSIVWRGEPCACQFLVTLPATTSDRNCNLRVRVFLSGVPIGSLRLALRVFVAQVRTVGGIGICGDSASLYRRAFLSYATPDRTQAGSGTPSSSHPIFQDVLSIEPGERWAQRLYEEIDRCDLFLLFWSNSAARSEWVLREAELAVARQNASSDEEPDITPIILEGPPVPQPIPESLKHLHFNDHLLYLIAATERDRNPPSRPFATVAVEGNFGSGAGRACAYSGRSLTRMSSAGTPAPAARASVQSSARHFGPACLARRAKVRPERNR